MILKKVEDYCHRNHLFSDGANIVIACSGGPDSLALADVFLRLRSKYKLKLCIAHFEHGIRGKDSQDDAFFVSEYAHSHEVDYRQESADVPSWAGKHKLSIEMAARALRYEFLRRVSHAMGEAVIATAHHANDQAETVLLHLLRGSGMDGMSGMRPQNADIIRPFLCLQRKEIEEYCTVHGLHPRHDVTNDDPAYLRNRVRLQLLPALLSEYNPLLVESLCRLAELARADNDFLCKTVSNIGQDIISYEAGLVTIICRDFANFHLSLQRRLIRYAVAKLLGSDNGIGYTHIEACRSMLIKQHTGACLHLPNGLTMQLECGKALLYHEDDAYMEYIPVLEKDFHIPDTMKFPAHHYFLQSFISEAKPISSAWSVYFDLNKIALPLHIRSFQLGDVLFCEKGHKKLKKIFSEKKIGKIQRRSIPLVCDANDEILWVCGLRRSSIALATNTTKEFLVLQLAALSASCEKG